MRCCWIEDPREKIGVADFDLLDTKGIKDVKSAYSLFHFKRSIPFRSYPINVKLLMANNQ